MLTGAQALKHALLDSEDSDKILIFASLDKKYFWNLSGFSKFDFSLTFSSLDITCFGPRFLHLHIYSACLLWDSQSCNLCLTLMWRNCQLLLCQIPLLSLSVFALLSAVLFWETVPFVAVSHFLDPVRCLFVLACLNTCSSAFGCFNCQVLDSEPPSPHANLSIPIISSSQSFFICVSAFLISSSFLNELLESPPSSLAYIIHLPCVAVCFAHWRL